MNGNNFRKVLLGLALVSALCVISLAIIIWLLAAKPNCPTTDVVTAPNTSTLLPSKFELGDLSLNINTGEILILTEKLQFITGVFRNIRESPTSDISNCSDVKSKVDQVVITLPDLELPPLGLKRWQLQSRQSDHNLIPVSGTVGVEEVICLENKSTQYKIEIESYLLSHGSAPVSTTLSTCYSVKQTAPLYSLANNGSVRGDNYISNCFNYGQSHWYGAAEVHDHHWPIEKWTINLQEYVTRDPYFPGFFGSVQERYWLSSAGLAIHVPFNIPLFVSMNSSGDRQLCFVSKFKDSVYHNIDNENLKLSFDICTSDNITDLHTTMATRFWSKPIGRPHLDTLVKPIWSTWAIYKKDINQTSLMEYADRILANNFSISQLEIDDDWTPRYGDWTFEISKFPDATGTIKNLKSRIPAVSIWIHPFIDTAAESFKYTANHGMLMKTKMFKTPGLIKWWNPGYAGVLDFSLDNTTSWFLGRLENLKQNFSIDSFKFDAGEIVWMPESCQMHKPYFHPSEYIKYYVDMAVSADNTSHRQEVRAGCLTQYAPVLVRMLDRRSRWGVDNGLRTLIPTALTFGLIGYPFILPDMIGGNAYNDVKVEPELYIRWLQVNVFLPAIQFSIPPWYFNDSMVVAHTKEMLTLRESYTGLFDRLSKESVDHGWPMVRPLWWTDPDDKDCHTIDDEFMLGNDLLVAPVVEKNMTQRNIYLPSGTWLDMINGKAELSGSQWHNNYSASLWQLPYFIRK